MDRTEQLIIEQLRQGKEEAYRFLFANHYAVLCHVAAQYVRDDFLAETIVSDVVFHLWEVRQSLQIEANLRGYLVSSVRHRCLDYLKSQRHQRELTTVSSLNNLPLVAYIQNDDYPLGRLLGQELENVIQQAIARLPEDCRRVFCMSRFDGKKYQEISQELGITVNTVKYHMKHALQLLHDDLHQYLLTLFFVFIGN